MNNEPTDVAYNALLNAAGLGKNTPNSSPRAEQLKNSPSFSNLSPRPIQEDIEEILSRHGYETQDVKLLEGEKVRYIKAKSEGGHIVFIDLDRAGKVSVHPTDFSMKETPEILVSNSISRGSLGCVEPEVKGVAIECESGVCTLVRDKEFGLTEKNFSAGTLIPQYSSLPYARPIIRLSDLTTEPDRVDEFVELSSQRIIRSEIFHCDSVISSFPSSLKELQASYNRLVEVYPIKKKELIKSITELESFLPSYRKNPPVTEEGKRKFELLQLNLRIRREKLFELVSICRTLGQINQVLKEGSQDVNVATSDLVRNFEDLDYVYDTN